MKLMTTDIQGLSFKESEDGIWMVLDTGRYQGMINIGNLVNEEKEKNNYLGSFTMLHTVLAKKFETIHHLKVSNRDYKLCPVCEKNKWFYKDKDGKSKRVCETCMAEENKDQS